MHRSIQCILSKTTVTCVPVLTDLYREMAAQQRQIAML